MEEFLSSLGTDLLARVLGYVQLYKAKKQIFFPFIHLSVRFKIFFQPSSSLMVSYSHNKYLLSQVLHEEK